MLGAKACTEDKRTSQPREQVEKINYVTKAYIMCSFTSSPLFSIKPCEVHMILLIYKSRNRGSGMVNKWRRSHNQRAAKLGWGSGLGTLNSSLCSPYCLPPTELLDSDWDWPALGLSEKPVSAVAATEEGQVISRNPEDSSLSTRGSGLRCVCEQEGSEIAQIPIVTSVHRTGVIWKQLRFQLSKPQELKGTSVRVE